MKTAPNPKTCFLLMPFSEPFNEYYKEVYKPAILAAGLQPFRADEIVAARPFIQDIIESIKNADVLLAEITGRNPNVMYELGFAYALEKPIIIVSQSVAEAPTDLMHQRIILYKTIEPNWTSKLRSDITQAVIEATYGARQADAHLSEIDRLIDLYNHVHERDDQKRVVEKLRIKEEILKQARFVSNPEIYYHRNDEGSRLVFATILALKPKQEMLPQLIDLIRHSKHKFVWGVGLDAIEAYTKKLKLSESMKIRLRAELEVMKLNKIHQGTARIIKRIDEIISILQKEDHG